jgi:phytoene synthase
LADAGADEAGYIASLVKTGDRDRYWCALLAPEAARPGLLAFYAFNIEIARIPEHISEPQLGEIRLQWWREALAAALEAGASDHPVLAGLARAAAAHGLPAEPLHGLIDARAFDLYREPMPDFAALDRYLNATAGALFSLGVRILGAPAMEAASKDAALAHGLTGLMRALPYHAARGQLFLPQSLLAAHGLHPDVILQGIDNADLRAALRETGQRAGNALARAAQAVKAAPRAALPAFLPLALTGPYLKMLADPARNPLRDAAELNPLKRYALIWRAYLRGAI